VFFVIGFDFVGYVIGFLYFVILYESYNIKLMSSICW